MTPRTITTTADALACTTPQEFTHQYRAVAYAVITAIATFGTPMARAFEFNTGIEDLKVRWDNTLKYSAAWRVKDQSSKLTGDANQDDGDRNFDKGLISNRVDILSELDVTRNNVGMRLSGAGWYDSVYNQSNDNDSPFTNNSTSASYDHFTSDTQKLHGRKAELLDAFVFGKTDIGDMPATLRVGQHTVLYGESLFYGANGIAGGQAPTDIVKLLSVPGTQFKELVRPVPQISGQLQLRDNLALGAYYQLHWEKDRLPAAGSYFSTVDLLDDGGDSILAGPGSRFIRGKDKDAKDSGQFGLQLRWRPENIDAEFGLYAIQYNAKSPVVHTHLSPAFAPTTYELVYPEDIRAVGASFSTTVGDTNVAGEFSVRDNMPLVPAAGAVTVFPGQEASNGSHPLYPVGRTAHGQVSWIGLLDAGPLWEGGSFIGEVAWNRRLSVTKNADALDPNSTRDAGAIRMIFEPAYYQVLDGVDLTVPIGVGYGLFGKSSVINPGFSVNHGGDYSIGVKADYLKTWKFSLVYTGFFGGEGTSVEPANSPVQAYSYGQSLKDRDFIAFSVQRSL
ncbi:DUF1302 domain-containing protein [Pseudomonas sp. Pseu.R1]|uniref:DUF1302 domain-containing protein n=1 Tax=Pseudomonas sp. Pseu.R1 TaxID=3379818 RepID=UPI003B92E2CF